MSDVMGTPIFGVPVTHDSLNGVKFLTNITHVNSVKEIKIPNGQV